MQSASTSTKNLQHDDPAVLFSSPKKLTRYDKAQLMKMQELQLSQQKPPCLFDPRIMRLSIFKLENDGVQVGSTLEDRVKMLQENLQTLALQNWNSTIYQNYRSYHYALLNPEKNNPRPDSEQMKFKTWSPQSIQPSNVPSPHPPPPMVQPPQNQQDAASNSRRRVSFDMDQQKAALNKILTYDRRSVFFDTLTTTTMMRPPPRSGANAFQQPRRNTFSRPQRNSFDNATYHKNPSGPERFSPSFAGGYFPANDTRSSNDESRNSEKSINSSSGAAEVSQTRKPKAEDEETEPEWFSFPATRHDFVDLHGFNDEDEVKLKSTTSPVKRGDIAEPSAKYGNSSFRKHQSPRFGTTGNFHYNHHQQQQQYHHQNHHQNDNAFMFPNPHVSFYNRGPNQSGGNNHGNNFYANNTQRFRNPLHQPNKSPNPKTPTLPPAVTNTFAPRDYLGFQPMNPYYEAWKSDKIVNHKNVNFTHLMQHANFRQMPASMKLMSEVEQGMMQSSQAASAGRPAGGNIQQFFQNFSGANSSSNSMAIDVQQHQQQQRMPEIYSLPTREQLQQHTSEILRNAILRNRDQQYHDENNQY